MRNGSKNGHGLSKATQNFVQKMLHSDPNMRIHAEEALNNKWFKKASVKRMNAQKFLTILKNVQILKAEGILDEVALTNFVQGKIARQERHDLKALFRELEEIHNGKMFHDKLMSSLNEIYGENYVSMNSEKLVDIASGDQIENINYYEFEMAWKYKHMYYYDNMIEKAFNYFDKNNDGRINVDEFNDIMGDQ